MWNWIAKLLKSRQDTSADASGEILVSDEDYDFKVGTKPTLPDGLRDLKITELQNGLLLLEHFDADLTVDQKAWDRTIQDIAASTRIYRWATCYHDLAPVNHSPVRLHGDNLLLSDSHYSETHGPEAPWDIGKPQKALIDVAGQITGSILDAGCGTGENALYFAKLGYKVTGIDFLSEPISRAKQKAAERGLTASFLVMDALTLKDLPEVFDTVIDSGLFHVFGDDDRHRYVEGLATIVKRGGRLFLLCFSDEEPGTQGPRRVTAGEIGDAFAEGWVVESIEPSRFEIRPDMKDLKFTDGGPKAWFVVVRRR